MRVVVDTSILIDKLRGGKKWDEIFKSFDPDSKLFLPTIVAFELFLGESSREKTVETTINNFKKFFEQIELTWDIEKRAAEIHRDYAKDIDAADCIIAATALSIGAAVVTLNKKHFEKIPGLSVYPN